LPNITEFTRDQRTAYGTIAKYSLHAWTLIKYNYYIIMYDLYLYWAAEAAEMTFASNYTALTDIKFHATQRLNG